MKLKNIAIFSTIAIVSVTSVIPMAAQANVDASQGKKANIYADYGTQKLGKGELLLLDNNIYLKAKDEGGTSTKPERNWNSSNSN